MIRNEEKTQKKEMREMHIRESINITKHIAIVNVKKI